MPFRKPSGNDDVGMVLQFSELIPFRPRGLALCRYEAFLEL